MSIEPPLEAQLDHLRNTVAAYAVQLVEQDGKIKYLERIITTLQSELSTTDEQTVQ